MCTFRYPNVYRFFFEVENLQIHMSTQNLNGPLTNIIININNNTDNKDTLCLLGGYTGDNSPFVNISGYNLISGGWETSHGGTFIANNIYGIGDFAFENNDLIYCTDNINGIISCEGYSTCFGVSMIKHANKLVCIGYRSCEQVDIISGISNVYLFARDAGRDSFIE